MGQQEDYGIHWRPWSRRRTRQQEYHRYHRPESISPTPPARNVTIVGTGRRTHSVVLFLVCLMVYEVLFIRGRYRNLMARVRKLKFPSRKQIFSGFGDRCDMTSSSSHCEEIGVCFRCDTRGYIIIKLLREARLPPRRWLALQLWRPPTTAAVRPTA